MKQIPKELDLSLEVILLLACGLAMFVLGAVLLPVTAGTLPFYEPGAYGLLLVLSGLQWQITGITPFGFVKRSWQFLIPAIIVTVIGFATCFIPGILGNIPKYLVSLIFGIGGIVLLLGLFGARRQYPVGKTPEGRVFARLTFSCAAVYIMEILIAGLIAMQSWLPGIITTGLMAVVFLVFSITLVCLSAILVKVYRLHPEADRATHSPGIPPDTLMGTEFGLYMMVLGVLLVPVCLGLLPFSPSAQLGTMAVVLGIQALVAGTMMTFTFRRSRVLFVAALVLVAAGTFDIIIPDTIVEPLTIFFGAFNIAGGLYLIGNQVLPNLTHREPALNLERNDLWLAVSLLAVALIIAGLMLTLGISMLIPTLIPNMISVIVLIAFGLAQIASLHLQSVAEKRGLV